ncbi:hypothetical protein GCM10010404_85680 [Nonomuraea africana]|uniref:S8 family serine peptidase n=1 Tax=Nonomuraea africana TaxID=46171 RepID=UPI0031DF379E
MYAAAALATAVTTAAPVVASVVVPTAPAPAPGQPPRPYLVTAVDRAEARSLLADGRLRVRRYYTSALPGFATWLTDDEAAVLRADSRVRAVEPDREVHALGLPPRRAPSSTSPNGGGVTVYVLDTGVDVTRGTFGDRAWRAFDATGGQGRACGGHGTRTAALAAGGRHGAAPGARVASVKVLGCDRSGPLSDVVAGLDWVRGHARRPAVAVLAVDAARSPAVNAAARRLRRSGVLVVTSPLAAGTVARHLESHPAPAPSTLASWLKSTTARDAIRQNPSRTPNLLLHGGGR